MRGKMKLATITVSAIFIVAEAHAGNYAECILDKMPGTSNAPAAFAVSKSCTTEYAGQYGTVERGSGLGLFGFKDPEACIIKRSRDTAQPNAAFMIAAACRCLYGKPEFKGQTCG
jgi:hypothetical protein